MEIKFLTNGESPVFGPFKEGDVRLCAESLGKILCARGLAEEIKVKALKKEGKDNG